MARIAGVDIPRDKRIEVALTYIYGVGRTLSNKILTQAGSLGSVNFGLSRQAEHSQGQYCNMSQHSVLLAALEWRRQFVLAANQFRPASRDCRSVRSPSWRRVGPV